MRRISTISRMGLSAAALAGIVAVIHPLPSLARGGAGGGGYGGGFYGGGYGYYPGYC